MTSFLVRNNPRSNLCRLLADNKDYAELPQSSNEKEDEIKRDSLQLTLSALITKAPSDGLLPMMDRLILTAGGTGHRDLLSQHLVSADGEKTTVLQIILQEAAQAGIKSIGVVVRPEDLASLEQSLNAPPVAVEFIPQHEPKGSAHAITCASQFVGSEPFFILYGDHLLLNLTETITQLRTQYQQYQCCLSTVNLTHERDIRHFGVIGGERLPEQDNLYHVSTILEKPSPTQAESELWIPGLRQGYYLAFHGLHLLTPSAFLQLQSMVEQKPDLIIGDGLSQILSDEKLLGVEAPSDRIDLGEKYGLLKAQLALSLKGKDRDTILQEVIRLLK